MTESSMAVSNDPRKDNYERNRALKSNINKAATKFNLKPKKGIEYLLDFNNAKDVEYGEAFARDGVDGTSLQVVADAVGIRKPSLLHHFPSKTALRDAVLDELLAHWKDDLPRAMAAARR